MTSIKVALITGGARRIGAAIVRKLHQQGINTIIHYNTSKREAQSLAQELNQNRSNSAITLQATLGNHEQMKRLVEESVAAWGRLDILINNASSFFPTPLGEVDIEQWHNLMNSNLLGPFFITQQSIPFLKKQHGNVVNILDIYGMKPLHNYSIYCAAKAGLASLTCSMALELAPEIRVNGIAPHIIIWPEGQNAVDDKLKEKIIHRIPLQRSGNPIDIANCVSFFIAQPYITGEILYVDGGRHLR